MNGSPTAQLQAFSQSVYLMIKNRYYDDLTSTDGMNYVLAVSDWANMFIDELETEVDADGSPIDWTWARQPNTTIGTAVVGATTIDWDSKTYNNLVISTERFVTLVNAAGVAIAYFSVVNSNEVSSDSRRNNMDMCYRVGDTVYFSRPFSATEDGCSIVADVTIWMPKIQASVTGNALTVSNVKVFNMVQPLTLLKLGTAKNAILPDIVQGGLTPSYAQKYDTLLTNAINHSTRSSLSPTATYDNFQSIGGVGY